MISGCFLSENPNHHIMGNTVNWEDAGYSHPQSCLHTLAGDWMIENCHDRSTVGSISESRLHSLAPSHRNAETEFFQENSVSFPRNPVGCNQPTEQGEIKGTNSDCDSVLIEVSQVYSRQPQKHEKSLPKLPKNGFMPDYSNRILNVQIDTTHIPLQIV